MGYSNLGGSRMDAPMGGSDPEGLPREPINPNDHNYEVEVIHRYPLVAADAKDALNSVPFMVKAFAPFPGTGQVRIRKAGVVVLTANLTDVKLFRLPNSIPGEETCTCPGKGSVKYRDCKFKGIEKGICKEVSGGTN